MNSPTDRLPAVAMVGNTGSPAAAATALEIMASAVSYRAEARASALAAALDGVALR